MALANEKLRNGIKLAPARSPAKDRSTGTNWATKMILPPCRTDHAADNCGAGRNDDDRADVEVVLGPRINRRSEKCGFARYRKAEAFESDDGGNCD